MDIEKESKEKLIDKNTTDPVCGMTVDPLSASVKKYNFEKENYYFCSDGCLGKFKNEPHKYIKPKTHDSHIR